MIKIELLIILMKLKIPFFWTVLNLRKWFSNFLLINVHYDENNIKSEGTVTKVLGLQCTTVNDIIYLVKNIGVNAEIKYSIIKQLTFIFDPFGLLKPTIIKGKILLQTLWLIEYKCDRKVSTDLLKMWKLIA